jgi:hypothetical protein
MYLSPVQEKEALMSLIRRALRALDRLLLGENQYGRSLLLENALADAREARL